MPPDPNSVPSLLKFLENPSSHALTLMVGLLMYHFVIVRPLIGPLMKRMDRIFDVIVKVIEERKG